MGTRSTIALEFADNSVQQIYTHWDGYLENNGMILYKHYVDPFKTRSLIDLGGFSSLRNTVEESAETAYSKTHGDSVDINYFADYADYIENHQYEEYEYILRRDGFWYVKCHSEPYVLLAEALAEELIAEAMKEETLQD
jgi:hypothetical protein